MLGDIIADEGVPAIEKARHRPLPALAQVRPLCHHELAILETLLQIGGHACQPLASPSAIEALVPASQADGCLSLADAWRHPLLVWVDPVCLCSDMQKCSPGSARSGTVQALCNWGRWCHRDPSAWVCYPSCTGQQISLVHFLIVHLNAANENISQRHWMQQQHMSSHLVLPSLFFSLPHRLFFSVACSWCRTATRPPAVQCWGRWKLCTCRRGPQASGRCWVV